MTDRRARLAATRSPAFMAGRRAYCVMGWAEDACPFALPVNREDFIRGWESANDDYWFDREDRQPIHRRPSPMSAFERNRP